MSKVTFVTMPKETYELHIDREFVATIHATDDNFDKLVELISDDEDVEITFSKEALAEMDIIRPEQA